MHAALECCISNADEVFNLETVPALVDTLLGWRNFGVGSVR
jgi:hypothetical protein